MDTVVSYIHFILSLILTLEHRSTLSLPKSRSQHSCLTSPSLNSDTFSDDDESSNGSCASAYQSREQIKNQLMSKWRFPTLTVHKVNASIDNPTIISNSVTATISMRIVPNQEISDICNNFKLYAYQIFNQLKSDNQIQVLSSNQNIHSSINITYRLIFRALLIIGWVIQIVDTLKQQN